MDSTDLATISVVGFGVAFMHAALPNHWLPFVLVARARGWSRGRALSVTAFAGLGHVALTSALGLAIALIGVQAEELLEERFPVFVSAFFIAIGCYYFWRQATGRGICHHQLPGPHQRSDKCGHEHDSSHWEHELRDSPVVSDRTGDGVAIRALFIMLTLSPCEAFLPVYASGVQYGWTGFVVLSAILAVAALLGMLLFTGLALVGFDRSGLSRFEKREAMLLGVLFTALGVLVFVIER